MSANGYGVILGDLLARRYRDNFLPGPQRLLLSKRRFELSGYTVLTAATAATLVRGGDYLASFKAMTKCYSSRVSGSHLENRISFHHREKYAPVSVTPIAWSSGSFDKVLAEVSRFSTVLGCSAAIAHDCRVAVEAVFRARSGTSKEVIADMVARSFACTTEQLCAAIDKPVSASSDVSIVLPAVSAFLKSESVEQAVNLAVTATKGNGAIAALTGTLAEAFYQTLPWPVWQLCFDALDSCLEEIFDEFFIGCMCGNDTEIRLGRLVLPPEAPEAWQRWPVSINLAFTLYDNFCVSRNLINEYRRPTLYEAAIKLFESETNDYVFPSYGIHAEGVVPAFEWYVSWPLLRRGTEDGILRRGKISGAEGWDGLYESTLVRLYRFPTKYSDSSWSYLPSQGRLMLDVGGRTKDETINNWYRLAKALRKIRRNKRIT